MKYYYALSPLLFGVSIVLVQSQVALGLSAQEVEQIGKEITVRIVDAQNPSIAGSGVIIKHAGNTYTVLTTYHVVKDATKYQIILPDKQSYALNNIKPLDKEVDLAVASFSSSNSYQVAKIGNVVAAAPKAEDFLIKGNQKYQDKDFEGAIADCNSALKINPNYALVYVNRGFVRDELKDFEGAIADFNSALKINPNFVQVYVDRGLVRSNLGDLQGAIADYNSAIKINPNFAEAYYNRGVVHYQLGDNQGVINDLEKAAELFQQQGKTEFYQQALEVIKKIQQ